MYDISPRGGHGVRWDFKEPLQVRGLGADRAETPIPVLVLVYEIHAGRADRQGRGTQRGVIVKQLSVVGF